MSDALKAALPFALLFAPFAAFLLTLRFVPPDRRPTLRLSLPGWRSLPRETREILGEAACLLALGALGDRWVDFNPLVRILFWASLAFYLGAAFGHWDAARKARAAARREDGAADGQD